MLVLSTGAALAATTLLGASNPMNYFRPEDAVAYSNSVNSLRNIQQGELYAMTWDGQADYHADRLLAAGCTNSLGMVLWLCDNVLDGAPPPRVVTDFGCSAFCATNDFGNRLVGRNFDYRYRMAHALVFIPRNSELDRPYASVSTVDCGWVGYDVGGLDDGSTNDVSYAALFPHLPMDGMNEKGLMVTVLSLDAHTKGPAMTEQYCPGRTNLVTTTAIRYLLDHAATTEEGVNMLTNRFNMFFAIGGGIPIAANYHFYVCDRTGDARVVEWLQPKGADPSWTAWVTNATAVSNFYLNDGYGHGSNRWEILRHALARRENCLADPEAVELSRAVAQHKGAEQTSWTHWSAIYNLGDLTAHIATLGNYEEIFPYQIDAQTNGWTVGEAKTAKPQVQTEMTPFDPKTALVGKVYRWTVSELGESRTDNLLSWEMAGVSAVNRMGCAYGSRDTPIHVAIRADCKGMKSRAALYADMSSRDAGHWPDYVVAGVNEKGLAGRVTRLKATGASGTLGPCRALTLALLSCERISEINGVLDGRPAQNDVGLIFADAMGNIAVWPEGAVLPTDDASELVANSLDLRKGIYEIDGSVRGQFDELPGLMRLSAPGNMRAVVSMGYGHLDVATNHAVDANWVCRTEVGGSKVPAYGVIAEPPSVANTTATLAYTNGDDVVRNNQGRIVAETNAALRVTYRVTDGQYGFEHGAVTWTRDFTVGPTVTTPPAPEAPAVFPPGSAERPWAIGATDEDSVVAWTNGTGTLMIAGEGRMRVFAADGSDMPWPVLEVRDVKIAGAVTEIGTNAWYGLAEGVTYNGLNTAAARTLADGFGGVVGYARTPFKSIQPNGSAVTLSVALETTPSITSEWTEVKLDAGSVEVDSNGRILIQHQTESQKQGFYVIQPVK